jgi:hypothetical protein
MQRSEMRGSLSHGFLNYAALYPGYVQELSRNRSLR